MKLFFAALQWMAFIITSTIVVPIAIAQAYSLGPEDTAVLVQNTVFVLGVAALVQSLYGHRLPINEGPAGLWWGVFAIYAGLSTTLYASNIETLRALQSAMYMSAGFFFLFSLFGWIQKLAKLFTPVVTGTYLLLLVFQLSGPIVGGIMGVGYKSNEVDLFVFLLAMITIAFTLFLSRRKETFLKQYSILIGLAFGWILFYLFGEAKPIQAAESVLAYPRWFPFGPPFLDWSLLPTAFFITILLIVNMLASIKVVEIAVEKLTGETHKDHSKSAGFASAINHMISGVFGAIGPVPISGAAGFISTTKLSSKKPFILGSLLIIGISFIPSVIQTFSALPTPVGFAVNFVIFSSMIGMALSEYDQYKDHRRIRTVIGLALLTGVGAMFTPEDAFASVPPLLISLLNNGLVLGTIVAIFVDQFSLRRERSRQI
ncbi:purine/pyrimidine permease [Metabacillus arenae]|uniref:Purine/pyrimidine permease n=1 Tax=Metabacillus arenae TaxID=2771434 RepID=A0A926NAC2_9BACI|nr:purine/pyrimidine permease [Metabacillus arenae]MBD1379724.1 purine/pyrimidine permease [Metabacillus arenae]